MSMEIFQKVREMGKTSKEKSVDIDVELPLIQNPFVTDL